MLCEGRACGLAPDTGMWFGLGNAPPPRPLLSHKGSQVTPTWVCRWQWPTSRLGSGTGQTWRSRQARGSGEQLPWVTAQNFFYPLCQLPRLIVSQSRSPPSALPIPSLQLGCFPQRSRRFKAQDSRCTGKVGSMQPSVVLGRLGAPGHHNPDSKALQWIHTVVLGLSRHGWVRKLKKASMWNLINLLGSAFWGRRSRRGGEFPRAGSIV